MGVVMPDLDFKNLSSEQEKTLREIISISRYLQQASRWNPPVSDTVLAQQAREIAWRMLQLEKVAA
jgi:hypothetical protein